MAIFNRYVTTYQTVDPIKTHNETTIFLWFPMVSHYHRVTHYFDLAIFNGYVSHNQRVATSIDLAIVSHQGSMDLLNR